MITMATADATNAAPNPATRGEILPDLGACAGACCDAACCEADCCEAVCGMAIPLCQQYSESNAPSISDIAHAGSRTRGLATPRRLSGHLPPSIGIETPM